MTCQRSFPEELLSGYLDGALTQIEEQHVRLHVDGCRPCREIVEEMSSLRQAAVSTTFRLPEEEEWDELPKTPLSRLSRHLGWLILTVWTLSMLLFVGWQVATADGPWIEKALAFGSASGLALLLLSAWLDRRQALRTDRYTRVHR